MQIKAKIDAGVPGRDWIKPLAGRDNDKVWPKLANGRLAHGGPVIAKGALYEVPDGTSLDGPLGDIFEPVKAKRKAKDEE